MTSGISLIRLALLQLRPAPSGGNHFGAEVREVRVETMGSAQIDGGLELLLSAEIELAHKPKRTAAGHVVVPPRERAQLENALETVANMIAVFEEVERSISSPMPSVAFRPHSEDARAWLDQAGGIHNLGQLQDIPGLTASLSLEEADLQAALIDRYDGLALLAEVHAQGHALGRYRDLVRFFERAFALASARLDGPLCDFLDPRFGYTRNEIEQWLAVRDPASHADLRRNFALEPDARPFLRRMEQAARDVLFNKETWRSPSLERRDAWMPTSWTSSEHGDGKVLLGTPGRVHATILDEFGVYPTDLRNVRRVPDTFWCPIVTPRTVERSFEAIAPNGS